MKTRAQCPPIVVRSLASHPTLGSARILDKAWALTMECPAGFAGIVASVVAPYLGRGQFHKLSSGPILEK
eukprot:3790936-Heterocapsa_arctica.AAC.1